MAYKPYYSGISGGLVRVTGLAEVRYPIGLKLYLHQYVHTHELRPILAILIGIVRQV
jgi:hypothetical protein